MSRRTVQSVSSVLLVLVILVVVLLVLGDVGTPREQTVQRIQPTASAFEWDELATAPRVRVLPSNSTGGLENSTKIGIATINPPSNNRTVGLVVQFWIAGIADVNARLNSRLPRSSINRQDGRPFSGKRGWTVVRSLEPGEVHNEDITIHRCSKPGTYLLNADIWFIGDGEWKRRTSIGILTVENRPDSMKTELRCTVERVTGNVITCGRNPGQCIVDNEWAVMTLGVLLSILSLDQFWGIVDRVWNRFRITN